MQLKKSEFPGIFGFFLDLSGLFRIFPDFLASAPIDFLNFQASYGLEFISKCLKQICKMLKFKIMRWQGYARYVRIVICEIQ